MASTADGVPAAVSPPSPGHPSVLRADIDVSDFSAKTIKFLGEIGNIYQSPSIWTAFRRISDMHDRYTDKDVAAIYGELIGTRNAHLLTAFDREAPSMTRSSSPGAPNTCPASKRR